MTQGSIRVVTAASASLISRAEAKAFLHLESTDEDDLVDALIVAAHQYLMPPLGWLGRSIVPQTLRLDLPQWGRQIWLPCAPIVSLTSIKFYDTANVQRTLDPAQYFLDDDHVVWALPFSQVALYRRPSAVQVTYDAGHDPDTDPCPQTILLAMKQMISHWFENRDAVSLERNVPSVIPLTAEILLSPFRRMW